MKALTESMVVDWLDAYKRAWEQQDSELITSLFSETAQYIENPFEPAAVGREAIRQYWIDRPVTAQRDISFRSKLWALDGHVAIVHWQAQFTRTRTGEDARLDGVFRLSFQMSSSELPLCEKLEEWWFSTNG